MIHIRFSIFLESSLLQGNWGYSPVLQEIILSAIVARTPATAELALFSILLFIHWAIISGVIAGSRQHKASDHGFRITALSLPPCHLSSLL
jgi:ABC-type dipeptide/oligopeptide/nickel transport system permease component